MNVQTQVKVGVIGCGNISNQYLKACKAFHLLDVIACADIDMARAKAKAEEFGLRACTVEELLDDPEIEIGINLTIPQAHAQVNRAVLAAGKHAYCEKPFAVTREDGRRTLVAAREAGLLVGGAPDTFLGGGLQTCRKLVDEGAIGEPIAAVAFMTGHGHESWHPDPQFYYEPGGGPMLDMGPYYLTALVNLLGPVQRVTGSTRITFPERLITSQPRYGERIQAQVPTHVAGVIDFERGAVATIITSFDIWHANLPHIEVYGSEGSLSVPDPNQFGGPVRLRAAQDKEWTEVPLTHSAQVGRGIGVADFASALVHHRTPRASGELAFHVLDVMQAFDEASQSGRHIEIASRCDKPAPLPMGLAPGEID